MIEPLVAVARSTKQKDAAGLGALAFAFFEGDQSMFDVVPSKRDLRIVTEALKRPRAFFEWARTQCKEDAQARIIEVAQQYLPAATWGWDKATIIAGAYLAVSTGVPCLPPADSPVAEFPCWVALDKHTPEGKATLHRLSAESNHPYRHLIWASFYFESAVVNNLRTSPWFEAERNWRLRKAGLTPDLAKELWDRIRPAVAAQLVPCAAELSSRVLCRGPAQMGTPGDQ